MSDRGLLLTDFSRLTKRQQEVIKLVRLGLSNKEIARALGIEVGTVKAHLVSVFVRTGLHNRRQLMLQVLTPPLGYHAWPTPTPMD